ncbi:MAG: Coenzyme F420 hydrogenase/dehydrogenase, beta subunit C-terminal domain [Dehalococcoidales bacterium]|nr:Coenzyme F420 hydrogenase/dehydrogenase, beta subunit C-terminal domain [Dehalococcoidales bacterium]
MDKTIQSVVKAELCHGCGTCAAACPTGAIEIIRDDRRGIYVPRIDVELCNRCSVCVEVCPGHEVDFESLNRSVFSEQPTDYGIGVYQACYTGYATDNDRRYFGASGGAVTALLLSALDDGIIDGALVSRMSAENPLESESFIARAPEDIISAATSLYCPVSANLALGEILKTEGKYAVVGLPCHLHGIRKFELLNKTLSGRIALHIGIFCGYTYSFQATDYLLHKLGIDKKDVAGIRYRGEGWPGGGAISLKNGKKVDVPTFDLYSTLEFTFCPWRCTLCCDRTAELADISCGDAWLPELADDTVGSSILITRTPRGQDIIRQAVEKRRLHTADIGPADVARSQGYFVYKKIRIRFFLGLARLLRKGVPRYATTLERLSFRHVVGASLQSVAQVFGRNSWLWPLIPLFHRLTRRFYSTTPDMSE